MTSMVPLLPQPAGLATPASTAKGATAPGRSVGANATSSEPGGEVAGLAAAFTAALQALLAGKAPGDDDVAGTVASGEQAQPSDAEGQEASAAVAIGVVVPAVAQAAARAIEALNAAAPAAQEHAAPLRVAPGAPGGAGVVAAEVPQGEAPQMPAGAPIVEPAVADAVAPDAVAAAVPENAGADIEGATEVTAGEQPEPLAEPASGSPDATAPDAPDVVVRREAVETSEPETDRTPAPRASDRALEALASASPRAAEHAAPMRDASSSGDVAPEFAVDAVDATPAPQRAAEARSAEAVARPVPARPTEPHQQVVSVLRPFRESPDGTYRLTLQLQPEDLGRIRLEVQVRNGELSVHLSADEEVGREALREALPALQAELENSGFRRPDVDLGEWGARSRDDEAQPDGDGPGRSSEPETDSVPVATVDEDALVDLRI